METKDAPPPAAQLMQMIGGSWLSQTIYVAAELGIADLLVDGPKHVDALARSTDTLPETLYRILRALASCGIFVEQSQKVFAQSPLSACLRDDIPDSLRAIAVMFGSDFTRAAWSNILHAVRTGEPAFDGVHGVSFFEYASKHARAAKIFDEAMTSFTNQEVPAILEAYDFSELHHIVDIAGGHGRMLAAILKKYPQMRGTLFDMPTVIEVAREKDYFQGAGVVDRCSLVGGDFFQSVPKGADAYVMKHIIHDWSDRHCHTILSNIHNVIAPGGRVLLYEMVIPDGNQPHFGKLLDIEMLVQTHGGKERTESEFRDLFRAAGFSRTRFIPTHAPGSVIEALV